jgi:hypothetical protein
LSGFPIPLACFFLAAIAGTVIEHLLRKRI